MYKSIILLVASTEAIALKNPIQDMMANYVQVIDGPEELALLSFSREFRPFKAKAIYDADGDGIEDVENMDRDVLDEFYDPLVFGVAEDINNTRHGNLPGHKQLWFTEKLTQPVNHFQDIVQGSWETK